MLNRLKTCRTCVQLKKEFVLKKVQDLLKDIPADRCLSDELIAERRIAAEQE